MLSRSVLMNDFLESFRRCSIILRRTGFLRSNCERLLLVFHKKVGDTLLNISLLDKI